MRNFFYGFLIILAAVLVTHTATNSTLKGNPPATNNNARTVITRTVACSVQAESPAKSSTNLVGNGRFICDQPGADAVSMTVTVQKQASATTWVAVSSAAFHAGGAATSSAASNASRTHGATAACAAGTFRTVVDLSSTSAGGTKAASTASGAVTNPCG